MYKLLLDFFYLRVKKTSKATLLNFYMANHFIYYIIFSQKKFAKNNSLRRIHKLALTAYSSQTINTSILVPWEKYL